MPLDPALNLLKALANPSRLLLLNSLLDAPRCVEDLAQRLDLAPSTVSHHLKVLTRAGVVRAEHVQYYTEYELVERVLDPSLLDLVQAADDLQSVEDHRADRARQAVIDDHVRDGRITRLPLAMKKRFVVLEALAGDLDPARPYTADQLLSLLARRYADPELLRRELLAWDLITLEDDGYRLAGPPSALRLPPRPVGQPTPRPALGTLAPAPLVGVGWIRNRDTGRVHLLGSTNLHASLNRQRARLDAGQHPCEPLQDDWRTHGPDRFDLEILETLRPDEVDELGRLEQSWLAGLQPLDEHCYQPRTDIRDDIEPASASPQEGPA
jgi:DNA-binding transcriptional ArsR family regulator